MIVSMRDYNRLEKLHNSEYYANRNSRNSTRGFQLSNSIEDFYLVKSAYGPRKSVSLMKSLKPTAMLYNIAVMGEHNSDNALLISTLLKVTLPILIIIKCVGRHPS